MKGVWRVGSAHPAPKILLVEVDACMVDIKLVK